MGVAHFDSAPARDVEIGHLKGRWTDLGRAAGAVGVGVRRVQMPAGGWSTPAHEHGRQEEIFYVLGGDGLSWQNGRMAAVATGDCILYLPGNGAHTLYAREDLDVLAFGSRQVDESPRFPRIGLSLVGNRAVESVAGIVERVPIQFVREAALGAPDLPAEPEPRPSTIVALDAVTPDTVDRPRVARVRRNLGRAIGSVSTGLQHVELAPGKESAPQHCHSQEEEIFVILEGEGVLVLADEETAVGVGDVIARPAATGVAHMFRAAAQGLTYLAYGTRQAGDVCFYPRSNKIAFRGVSVIGRLERLDYWDGED